jgi:hypothetical protein
VGYDAVGRRRRFVREGGLSDVHVQDVPVVGGEVGEVSSVR